MKRKPHCRHCVKRKAVRARLLCDPCYSSAEIRDLYPPKSVYARRGVGASEPASDPEPTTAAPGTEGKILVLAARALAGERLWHPEDARLGERDTTPSDYPQLSLRRLQCR